MLIFLSIHMMIKYKYGVKKIWKENHSKYLLQKVAWVS